MFNRCYLQVGGKKYVRLYSPTYQLVTNAIEGSCRYDQGDALFCGNPACQTRCDATY